MRPFGLRDDDSRVLASVQVLASDRRRRIHYQFPKTRTRFESLVVEVNFENGADAGVGVRHVDRDRKSDCFLVILGIRIADVVVCRIKPTAERGPGAGLFVPYYGETSPKLTTVTA